jgi:hypothetical protein
LMSELTTNQIRQFDGSDTGGESQQQIPF